MGIGVRWDEPRFVQVTGVFSLMVFRGFMSLEDNGGRQRTAGEWDLVVQVNAEDADF